MCVWGALRAGTLELVEPQVSFLLEALASLQVTSLLLKTMPGLQGGAPVPVGWGKDWGEGAYLEDVISQTRRHRCSACLLPAAPAGALKCLAMATCPVAVVSEA